MYIDLRKVPKGVIGIEILDGKLLYYYNNKGKAIAGIVKGELTDQKPKPKNKNIGICYKAHTNYYSKPEWNKRCIKDPYQYKKYLESHGKRIPKWLVNF